MTEKPESVEALAERIARWANGRVFTDLPIYSDPIAKLIRDWQPTEKQQPADDAHREPEYEVTLEGRYFVRKEKTPLQPAEPVVTEGDRELVRSISNKCWRSYAPRLDHFYERVELFIEDIIAKARQAERDELRRLQKIVDDVGTGRLAMRLKDTLERRVAEGVEERSKLQAKLTAADERIRELERLLAVAAKSTSAALNEISNTRHTLRAAAQQPATADAKRKDSPDPQQWP